MATLSPKRLAGVCAVALALGIAAAAMPALAAEGPRVPAVAPSAAAEPCHAAVPDVAALLREATGPGAAGAGMAARPAAAEAPLVAPDFAAKPPLPRYCACGCGIGCVTDADCGPGGVCIRAVTCC